MLKKSFLSFKTKAALKSNKAVRSNLSFNKVRKIGILHHYVDDSSVQAIYHFFDQLEKNGKKVEVLIIKDKQDELNIPEFLVADQQETTQFGQWTNEDVQHFIKESFDYLIHLNGDSSVFTDNILAQSKAKCRVGKYTKSRKAYYELMVSPEQDTMKKLIDQIYHYIQIL